MSSIKHRKNIKKCKNDENNKQQSKLTFNGIHISYTHYSSYTFKQNEVVMDEPIYIGFAILALSKLRMYETYYDKLHPYFGQESNRRHYGGTDGIVISMNTKIIIKNLKNQGDLFDFSNLKENHEHFSNKNKKFIGKLKKEFPKNIWIDDFFCLRCKASSFICNGENINKMKGISESFSKNVNLKNIKNA